MKEKNSNDKMDVKVKLTRCFLIKIKIDNDIIMINDFFNYQLKKLINSIIISVC